MRGPVAGGLDVGARRVHLVLLDERRSVELALSSSTEQFAQDAGALGAVSWVAIDAPAAQSEPRHRGDANLSAKFRAARCAEVALGLERGYWVPWVTPAPGSPVAGWMQTGFFLWALVGHAGGQALEVYPHAAFGTLNGGQRLPTKQTPEGRSRRAGLLRQAGVAGAPLEEWSHDLLDAAVAALVAWHARAGSAEEVRCPDHEEPGIWLPPTSPSGGHEVAPGPRAGGDSRAGPGV